MRFMPDINTLIAIAWPNHVHHRYARRWFLSNASAGWATCAFVQTGFLRISMNSGVVGREVSFREADTLLRRYTADPHHTLWNSLSSPHRWPDWLTARIQGHRQVSDAVLVDAVVRNDGMLMTLDAGISSLLPSSEQERVRVIVP